VLGSIPSHWVHASNAMFATAYHRAVIFECEAAVSGDGEVLAAQQQRLMQHYQPDGGHATVTTEHAMYRGAFKEIRALTLTVCARKVKWKLGQNRKPEQLMKVIGELRQRGRPTDAAAADALQWSMDRDAAK
jgi:transcriptional regulator